MNPIKFFILLPIFFFSEYKIFRAYIINKFQAKKNEEFDLYFKKIIKSNNELPYKIKNKNLILVESLVNHPGYTLTQNIISNHFRKVTGSEIIYLIRKNNIYAKKIAKSFKINNLIYHEKPNFLSRIKNFFISVYLFLKIKNINDLLNLKYKKIFLGRNVYAHLIRLKKIGEYNKIDLNIFYHLYIFINSISFYEVIFKRYKIKYILQNEKNFYPRSTLFQLGLANKFNCYLKLGNHKFISLKRYKSIKNCFQNDSKFSHKLIKEIFNSKYKKKFIISGKKLMLNRLNGNSNRRDIKDSNHFSKGYLINKQELCKNFLWDVKKPIGLVLPNNLIDGVGNNSWSLFKDNAAWLKFLLNEIKKNNHVNWIVKEHPSDHLHNLKNGTKHYFNTIIKKKKNIKILPRNINTKSLHKIVNFVFSSHGSAGLEYPFLKIPCVTSSDSLYGSLGFTYECNNLYALKDIISKPEKLKPISDKTHDLLCVFLEIYINRSKFDIGLHDYDLTKNINYQKFNKSIYFLLKENYFYKKKFDKALTTQLKNDYRHTLDVPELK